MNYSCSRIVWFEPGDNGVGLYTSPTLLHFWTTNYKTVRVRNRERSFIS